MDGLWGYCDMQNAHCMVNVQGLTSEQSELAALQKQNLDNAQGCSYQLLDENKDQDCPAGNSWICRANRCDSESFGVNRKCYGFCEDIGDCSDHGHDFCEDLSLGICQTDPRLNEACCVTCTSLITQARVNSPQVQIRQIRQPSVPQPVNLRLNPVQQQVPSVQVRPVEVPSVQVRQNVPRPVNLRLNPVQQQVPSVPVPRTFNLQAQQVQRPRTFNLRAQQVQQVQQQVQQRPRTFNLQAQQVQLPRAQQQVQLPRAQQIFVAQQAQDEVNPEDSYYSMNATDETDEVLLP
jgi:hypothetical protein